MYKIAINEDTDNALIGAGIGHGLSIGGSLATIPANALAMKPGHGRDLEISRSLYEKYSPGLTEKGYVSDIIGQVMEKEKKKINRIKKFTPRKMKPIIDDIAEEYLENQGDKLERTYKSLGPFYSPKYKKIYNVADSVYNSNLEKSPGVLGHELGHAKIHRALGKAYPAITMVARKVGTLPMIGGLAGYYGYRNKDEKKAKALALSGLGLSGLSGAAVLADETAASILGRKMLKGVTNDKAIINNSTKRLISALGTYGAKYVLPVAAGGAIYAVDRRKRAKQGLAGDKASQGKTASYEPRLDQLVRYIGDGYGYKVASPQSGYNLVARVRSQGY